MPLETDLILKTKEYVGSFIADHFTEKICYHNIDHTIDVVEASEMIGKVSKISENDLELLLIAAWFHDTGYYLGNENHEDNSARIAVNFLRDQGLAESKIKVVKNCILATKIPQKPHNLLEEILCDADLYHLATDHFFEKSELLRQEMMAENEGMSSESWMNMSSEFIQCHHYHTDFAKRFLCPKKDANLKLLEQKMSRFCGNS